MPKYFANITYKSRRIACKVRSELARRTRTFTQSHHMALHPASLYVNCVLLAARRAVLRAASANRLCSIRRARSISVSVARCILLISFRRRSAALARGGEQDDELSIGCTRLAASYWRRFSRRAARSSSVSSARFLRFFSFRRRSLASFSLSDSLFISVDISDGAAPSIYATPAPLLVQPGASRSIFGFPDVTRDGAASGAAGCGGC